MLLLAALSCWLVAVPVLRTRAVVQEVKGLLSSRGCYPKDFRAAVSKLGTTEQAVTSIRLYLLCPDSVSIFCAPTLWPPTRLMLSTCSDTLERPRFPP